MGDTLRALYQQMGLSPAVIDLGERTGEKLSERFRRIDRRAEYNQMKVLQAMRECRVNAGHFASSTGYGYNDDGRDTLEQVYAKVFGCEDALVRAQLTCGTHALHVALSAILRPGDELLGGQLLW